MAFLYFIEDGVIKRNGETVCGFGVYMLMNMKEDSVYRIEYNGSVDVTINKAYYYKSNQLVFARLELLDRRGRFYRREELYKDAVNLSTVIKSSKEASGYLNQTALSFVEDGQKYLEYFKRANSRR